MKIRNGFVSNSSSSSFVCVVDAEAHDKAMCCVDDPKGILREVFSGHRIKRQKFNGRDVLIITGGDYEDYHVIGAYSSEDVSDEDVDAEGLEQHWEYWEEIVLPLWNEYKGYIPKNCCIEEWEDH